METHPYLEQGEIKGATRLILGSFPVWQCTDPESEAKQQLRQQTGTFRFFYGSSRNALWKLYSEHIEQLPADPTIEEIIKSLNRNKIAISDVVMSAQRKEEKSALDSHLRRKGWNKEQIDRMLNNGAGKVLCTSKGVLDWLESSVLCLARNPIAKKELTKSSDLQGTILSALPDNTKPPKKEIGRVFRLNQSGLIVEVIAIPLPEGTVIVN